MANTYFTLGLFIFGRHKKTKYLLLLLYIMASSLFMADIHTFFFMTFTTGSLQPTQHDKNENYYFLHMADIQPTQNLNKIQNSLSMEEGGSGFMN